jgi:hypothetical protein
VTRQRRIGASGVTTRPPRFRLRLTEDDDVELYCYGCQQWLPVSIAFWPARDRFWRCLTCEAERSRVYQARRRFDPEGRMKNIIKSRLYRAYLQGIDPALLDVEKAIRREELAGAARVRRADASDENKAVTRAYKADWQRRKRAEARAA